MKHFFIQKVNWTLTLILSALLIFIGAQQGRSQVLLSEDFSSGTLPTGWTAEDESFSGVNWAFDNPGGWFITGGDPGFDDNFAILDSDHFGGTGILEFSYLETAEFDASAAGFYFLTFDNSFAAYDDGTFFNGDGYVEVWDGTDWVEVLWLPYDTDDGAPTANHKVLNITSVVEGVVDAKVRFYWSFGNWGFYWAIDNVLIERVDELCVPAEGIVTRVPDCDNNTFELEIELTSMGDAATLELTDGTESIVVSSIGTYTFGPYAFGELAEVEILHPESGLCNMTTGVLTLDACPAPNDECEDALEIPVNTTASCETSITASTYFATASAVADPSCLVTALNDDVWFTFTAMEAVHGINIEWLSGAFDYQFAVYSGDCAGTLTEIACVPYSGTVFGLTVGEQYYVRVWTEFATVGEFLEFNICVTTPIEGSICADPIDVTALPYTHSSSTSLYGDFLEAEIPGSAASCGTDFDYLSGDDVVYSFTASTTTEIDIVASDLTETYAGMFVYEGCGDIGVNCAASTYNFSDVTDLSILGFPVVTGNTYYIVISTWASPQSVDYTLTITSDDEPCVVPDVAAANQTICAGATALLEATSTDATATFEWFDEEVGGTSLATGSTYTTASLTTTDTFWVVASSGLCSSDRIPVIVTVESIDVAAADQTICSGTTALLEATSTDATATFEWFDEEVGGTSLATGSTYSISSLTTTDTFWVVASSALCSSDRIPVIVTVESIDVIAGDAVVCAESTATLVASSSLGGVTFEWYDEATGGTLLGAGSSYTTSTLTTTTTFYVQAMSATCTSDRIGVEVVVSDLGISAGDVTLCGAGVATLTASATSSDATIQWFDVATGGTPLATGSGFETPELTAGTSYYVQAVTDVCTSDRIEVEVLFEEVSVSAPDVTICSGDDAILDATSSIGTATINWYDAATGGTLLHTGSTYNAGALTATTVFYVDASTGTCTSDRIEVTVTVNELSVVADDAVTCTGGVAVLTAVPSSSTALVEWFDVAAGGTVLGTGTEFTTGAITASPTTFYVQISEDGCTSDRIPVLVTLTSAIDVAAEGVDLCSDAPVSLTASSSLAGADFNWYDAVDATTPISIGAEYTTPVITATTSYWVEASSGGCVSDRLEVVVSYGTGTVPDVTAFASRICISGTSTIVASSSLSGATFRWYDVATGGTSLFEGATFETPALTENTDYWVEAEVGGCVSERYMVTVIYANPIVSANDTTICHNTSASILASSIPSGVIRWYADETSTTVLHIGATFTTPLLTDTTTYWITSTVHGCVSPRTSVTVNVLPVIDVITSDVVSCTEGSVTLSASSLIAGAVIEWYEDAVGGAPIAIGPTYETPELTGPTVYYVQATLGDCASDRVAVNISAGTPPDVTATASSICVSGVSTLTASSTIDGVTFNWYAEEEGGTALGTGSTFTTPEITDTTTFYVEADLSGCVSERVAVTVNVINPLVSVALDTICESGSVLLIATPHISGTIVRWYDSPTGPHIHSGTAFTTPILTTTTTFYVTGTVAGCVGERMPVTVEVIQPPVLDLTFDSICVEGSGNISVTSDADAVGVVYDWYDAPVDGTLIATGATFVTPSISTTTTYYVETSVGECVFSRTPVTMVVNNPQPVVADAYNCGEGTVTFTTAGPDGATFRWYSTATSTEVLATGTEFSTEVLSATRDYYVTAEIEGCEGSRLAVTAEIRPIPSVEGTDADICGPGSATLTATSDAGTATFEWFTDMTSTTPIAVGASFLTPVVTETTTYYVAAIDNECISERIAVTVNVNPVPTVTPAATEVCIEGTSTLTATSDLAGATFTWYTDAAGTLIVGAGASFTTPTLTANTTYYVTATLGDCTSALTDIEVIVNNPTMTATDVVLCDPGITTLTATSAEAGATIEWYASATGGTPIFVGSVYTTPFLSETTTYYVSGTFAGCVSPRIPVEVTVRNYDFEIEEGAVCEMGTVTLTASVDDATAVMEWYDDADLTTLLHTGTSFTTPVLTATTSYYVIAVTPECSTNPREVLATVNPLPFLSVDPTMALTCPGEPVTFTAFEDPDYTYLWSDGTTDAEMTTAEYGNHTVWVTDENGCQSSMTVFLDTIPSPTVEGFDYVPLIFTNPYLYTFSPVGAENTTGYHWDFGDGNTSDLETPDHEYAAFGTYEVKLTVYNECDSAVVSLTIYVHPTNSIDNEELNNQISIYPNPALQHLNIELDGNDHINKVTVYNQLGQLMMTENVDNLNKYTLSVDRLAQGSYMLIIDTKSGKQAVKKFVVQ